MNAQIGKLYESRTLATFVNLSFSLSTTKQTNDHGIDLYGFWRLGSRKVPVIFQCKCESRPTPTNYIREFEGALSRRPGGTVGFMVAKKGYSRNSIEYFGASVFPIVLVGMSEQGLIEGFLVNQQTSRLLPKLTSGIKRDGDGSASLVVMYRNKILYES